MLDLTGQRFGNILVLGLDEAKTKLKSRYCWKCQCDCGAIVSPYTDSLRSGKTQSCGCTRTKHGFKPRSKSVGIPEYTAWKNITQRCYNPEYPQYEDYGGRGIQVCERWRSDFQQFLKDVGYKPSPKHQIDRIDNNGHYEPNNVRWVLPSKNRRNSRTAYKITIGGETGCLRDWCRRYGIDPDRVSRWVKNHGYTYAQAIVAISEIKEKN